MREAVVIDIETIPGNQEQLALYKSIKCTHCKYNPETHPKQKKDYCGECDEDSALKWPTAQAICVTVKVVGEKGKMSCFCDKDEYKVLSQSYDLLESLEPAPWVGFNVKEFDFVQLRMRGLIHGIPFMDILPTNKYDRNVVDLYDNLVGGKWNKQQSATLEMMCAMLGFNDLLYGNGRDVGLWYLNNELDQIAEHNKGDVRATERLYLEVYQVGQKYRKSKLKKEMTEDEEETFKI
jgi:DNA polymerase elongation subunit (family B)